MKGKTKMAPETKKYTIFDLENMEQKKVEVTFEFTPAATYNEAVERAGSDEGKLTKYVNAGLKRELLSQKKKEAVASGASKAVVFKFVAPFRLAPPYSTMVTSADGTPAAREERKAQTKAILDFFKTNPAFVAANKAASEAAVEEDDDENDSDSE